MQQVDPRTKSRADVRRLFEAIAPRYDLMNRLLSAGFDARWRRRAVAAALDGLEHADVADLCCGTGDLALQFARDRRVRRVVGVDFSSRMIRLARAKAESCGPASPTSFVAGDAMETPLRAARFDVAAVAFGLRNLVDPAAGIREIGRLLRPGGRLLVLEFFAAGTGAKAAAFRFYFRHVLPRVGRLLSGAASIDAYRYLPDSVAAFARTDEVMGWCAEAGFEGVRCEPMLAGAVGLIQGRWSARPLRACEPAREACFA